MRYLAAFRFLGLRLKADKFKTDRSEYLCSYDTMYIQYHKCAEVGQSIESPLRVLNSFYEDSQWIVIPPFLSFFHKFVEYIN